MSLTKNAALVALTAIFVLYVPGFFQQEPPVVINGFVSKGFEDVKDAFRENFVTGRDSRTGGSAFAVYHKGEKVVDLWGGYADLQSHVAWREDTMSIVYSTTKGVAAICIAMLADRGLLDYDQPVAHYWPEFAQKGKGKITVRQLMEHEAGLVIAAPPGLSFELLKDVAKAGELMASTEPLWEVDGKTHGYHVLTFGPLTNELLRRVDPEHRTMGRFFQEEVAKPFGIDFYIGLPLEENYRVAKPGEMGNIIILLFKGITSSENRQVLWHILNSDLISRAVTNFEKTDLLHFSNPYHRVVELPSAWGIGRAQAIAKLYGILAVGGTDPETNNTLLSTKTVQKLFTRRPPTFDKTLGVPTAFILGLGAIDLVEGKMMYGHPGAGGQMGYADPTNQIGFAYVTTNMSPFLFRDDPRTITLLAALYRCVEKLQNK